MSRADITPGHCIYCGRRCDGRACAAHRDLIAVEEASAADNSLDNLVETVDGIDGQLVLPVPRGAYDENP